MINSLENIEKFVLGQMTDEEADDFQAAMAQDDDLRRNVEKMRLIGDAMELEIEGQLRSHLHGLLGKTNKPQGIKRLVQWSAAAAVLLLLSLAIWFYSRSGPNLQQFAQEHYLSYQSIDLRLDEEPAEISEGLALASKGSENEAIEWFENFLQTHPEAYESRFILADLLQKTGVNLRARDQFRLIASSSSMLWKEKASWNELLLSAQFDWDVLAGQRLDTLVADENHSYHDLATQLAKTLQR